MSDGPRSVGRYVLYDELASGGMATVHIGRLLGPAGFARTVAIKRLHAQYARDPEFIAMFLDEARLASRIRHPNVVPTLDVVSENDEVFLVMEYVHGESLARAWRAAAARGGRIPPRIAGAVAVGALHGLHAAHEARDEQGSLLQVVHRDVSPQNVMIGADGVARVLDFGVAKALGRSQETRDGQLKGKLSYMAPEQFRREPVTRLVDVYAASVVLWEALTGERLNAGDSEAGVVERVLFGDYRPVRDVVKELPESIDGVLAKGLARRPADRFESARELAIAVETSLGVASALEVAAWLGDIAGPALQARAARLAAVEAAGRSADSKGAPSAARVTIPDGRESRVGPLVALTATRTSEAIAVEPHVEPERRVTPRSRSWALALLVVVIAGAGVTTFEMKSRQALSTPVAPSAAAPPSAVATAVSELPSSTVVSGDEPAPSVPLAIPEVSAAPRRPRPASRPSRPEPSALPRGLPDSRD